MGTLPPATGGVVSFELYDAPGCVFDRVSTAKARVSGALAQPGDPDPGAIRAAYDEIVKARAGLAVAPATLSWGNSGTAAEAVRYRSVGVEMDPQYIALVRKAIPKLAGLTVVED